MARRAADVLAVCCRRAAGIGPSRRGGRRRERAVEDGGEAPQRARRAGRMLQTPWRASDAVDGAGNVGMLSELRGLVVKTECSQ